MAPAKKQSGAKNAIPRRRTLRIINRHALAWTNRNGMLLSMSDDKHIEAPDELYL